MNSFRKMICGFVLGVLVCICGSALAQMETSESFITKPQLFQMGYVEGVSDALGVASEIAPKLPNAAAVGKFLALQNDCILAQGKSVGAVSAMVAAKLKDPKRRTDNAASAMIGSCDAPQ